MATGLIINDFKVSVGSKQITQDRSYLLRQKINEFVNSEEFNQKFAQGGEFKFELSENRLKVFKKEEEEFKLQVVNTGTIEKTAQAFANLYSHNTLTSTLTPTRLGHKDLTGESNLHAGYSLFNIPSLRRRIEEKTPALLNDAQPTASTLKRFLPTGLATSNIKTTSLLEKALENEPLSRTRATLEGISDAQHSKGKKIKEHKSFLSEQNEEHAISLAFEAGKSFSDLFNEKFLTTSKAVTLKEGLFSKPFFKGTVTKKRKFDPLESLYIKIPKKRDQLNTPVDDIPLKIKQDDQEVELKGFISYDTDGGNAPVAVAYFKEFDPNTGKSNLVKHVRGERQEIENVDEFNESLKKATDLYYDSDKNLFERAPEDPPPFNIE